MWHIYWGFTGYQPLFCSLGIPIAGTVSITLPDSSLDSHPVRPYLYTAYSTAHNFYHYMLNIVIYVCMCIYIYQYYMLNIVIHRQLEMGCRQFPPSPRLELHSVKLPLCPSGFRPEARHCPLCWAFSSCSAAFSAGSRRPEWFCLNLAMWRSPGQPPGGWEAMWRGPSCVTFDSSCGFLKDG